MEKTVLIGMAPGPNTDPRAPLFPMPASSAGGRLQQFSGLTRHGYFRLFDRVNCLTHFPGKSGSTGEDLFPMREARRAAEIHKQHFRGRRIIFVGRQVAEVFGHPKQEMDWFEWSNCETWRYRCSVIPHTSGRNHFWNTEENRELAKKFFQDEINSRRGFTSGATDAMFSSGHRETENRNVPAE